MKFLTKLWTGKYSLAKTYWLFNLLTGAILSIPISFFGMLSMRTQSENSSLFFGFVCITGSYGLIATVGLWRSASNYTGNKLWAVLSKIVVCVAGFMLISSLIPFYKISAGYAFLYFLILVLVAVYLEHLSNSNNANQSMQMPDKNILTVEKPTIQSQNTDLIWESISKEFHTSNRKDGLWTKCFVEAEGDENKAKLQYLKIRFDEVSKDFKSAQKISTTPALISKINLSQDIFTIDPEPKVDSLDYSQFAASTLLSMGMFQRKQYKDRTFFYLHNGNVACTSGQLIKIFDTESFLKKAIDKETIGDTYPSGMIVSFDKNAIK
jgi:hypothetical protein